MSNKSKSSAECFDFSADQEELTTEDVRQAIAVLEQQGLVEWTGEYRPARDGTLEKVYRATEKRLLH
jgi:hypothetical protein